MRGRFPVSPIFSLTPVALRPRLRGGALSRGGQSALPRFARMGLPLHPSSPDLIRGSHKASKRSPGHGLATGPVMTKEEETTEILQPHRITPPPWQGKNLRQPFSRPVPLRQHKRATRGEEQRSCDREPKERVPVREQTAGRTPGRKTKTPARTVSRTCSRKPITASLPSPLWGGAGGGGQTKQSARPLHPTAKTSLWQSGRFSAIRWPERWPWPVFFHGLCWTASRHQASSSSSFERSAYDVDYT
jgi:hypothetical protein